MRIIFLTITFHPEPAIHGLPLAKCLAARGHEIKVLTAFPQYPIGRIYPGYRMRLWQWQTIDGIRILRVPIYPSHDNSATRRILTYLSFALTASTIGAALIGPADLVYLYEPPPTNGLASLALKVFRKTPIVHEIVDMWPETVIESGMIRGERTKRTAEALLSAWCRFLYRQAALITVLSPGFKRLLVERGIPEEKVHVIYNWTDEATYRPGARDPALARELGFEGRFNIVYAGNLGVYQGLESVIRAAALVRNHRRIQVVIAGTGPREAELKCLAEELGASNVLFLGRRQYWEMAKINSLADVLLIHLKDLGFLHTTIPGKTQVSLASGRPILMAVRGDAADLVREADAGVICEPENPAAIAKGMVEMSNMPRDELEAMGTRGRRYYERRLALNIAGEHFDRVFREAVGAQLRKDRWQVRAGGTTNHRLRARIMDAPGDNSWDQVLEERKLKEIEHSRVRRSILRGYERVSDTNPQEEAPRLKQLIRDEAAFQHHFSNTKFYSVAIRSEEYYQNWLRQWCPGAKALDYCCGNGENAIFMAKCGADVVGIDISPEGVENARTNAREEGVATRCRFEVMDGEAMTFSDNAFDVIVTYGALHHLDFDRAMAELSRVLKPDGAMIAIEALRHNPIFHLYRKMTMHLRTEWEVEHILTVGHLSRAQQYFGRVDAKFFHLAVLAAVPFRKTSVFRPLRRFLDGVDERLLRSRAIGKYGWMMVFTLGKPRKAGPAG